MNQIPGNAILHVYFLDLIAMIRVLPKCNDTIRTFTWKLLNTVPKQYDIIYLVCDSYKEKSIKSVERDSRGSGIKYILSKPDSRKLIDITTPLLSPIQCLALSGVHAFSGNDYISILFGKGKQTFWKTVIKSDEFIELFSSLGNSYQLPSELEQKLEKFICILYGFKTLNLVNEVRKCMFLQKYENHRNSFNFNVLPPCRKNYIATIYKKATFLIMSLEDPTQHGWNNELKADWYDVPFPDDVSEILFDVETSDEGSSVESSSDDDSDSDDSETD